MLLNEGYRVGALQLIEKLLRLRLASAIQTVEVDM